MKTSAGNKDRKIAETYKGPIEYTLKGRGPVILVVHGGHSNCLEEFGYDALLKEGYSVLTPSRPGYGGTPEYVGHTAEDTADALKNLIDYLGVDRVSVIGISAGGPTSLYFTAKYQHCVEKLVLEGAVSKAWLAKDDKYYRISKKIFNPRTQGIIWFMLRKYCNLMPHIAAKQMIPQFSTLSHDEVMEMMSEDDIEMFRRMNNRQCSDYGFMLDLEHDIDAEVLESIKAPTLIVHSKNDAFVFYEHALHSAKHIKNSQIYSENIWGHLVCMGSNKDRLNRKIIEFLKDG